MNPLIYVIAVAALFGGGAFAGWHACSEHRDALELREAQSKAQALEATAREIAKIDVKNVTIKQTLETQIREKTVYRDCKNSPEVMGTINDALRGGK